MNEANSRPPKDLLARGVTLRAVLIGLLLLPFNAYWIVQLEIVKFWSWPSLLALPMNCLFALFVFAVFNLILLKWFPRYAFSPAELLVIYIILAIGTALVGEDLLQVIVYTVAHPAYFASPENKWESLFLQNLPQWMIVADKEILKGFYLGESSFFKPEVWRAWQAPLLIWSFALIVVFWIMLCINVILRKQWTENERLTYPLVQMPLALVSGPQFFRNKLLWIGIAISSVIAISNGINVLMPTIPALLPPEARNLIIPPPVNPPWNAMGSIQTGFYPFIIGITMLIPTDLAFSIWFFYWFQKFELVFSQTAGFTAPGFPYLQQQSAGALIGLSLFVLWNERRYLLSVLRKALGRASDLDDSGEPLSYRTALLGIVFGIGALAVLSWQAGLAMRVLAIFLLLYFVLAIGITRMRAELGSPVHDLYWIGPELTMEQFAGTTAIGSLTAGKQNWVVLSLFYWMSRAYGSHPMPAQLEGFKMGERTGMNPRRLALVLMIAAVVGTLVGFITLTATMYHYGASTAKVRDVSSFFGGEPFNMLAGRLNTPKPPDWGHNGATIFGMLFSFGLLTARLRLGNWPFHPLGFALAGSWYIQSVFWGSILIGWLIKVLLLRYGGQRAYLRGLPLFFGLILGDCFWGVFWLVIGVVLNKTTYSVWSSGG